MCATKLFPFINLFWFAVFSAGVCRSTDSPVLRLEYVAYEEDPLILYCNDLAIINGHLYLVENQQSRILKMPWTDPLPEAEVYAGKGEGPGEVYLPIEIATGGGMITVKDNRGFSFFREDGTFLSRFKVFTGYLSFTRTDRAVYFASANELSDHLIDVFAPSGRKTHSFGEKFLGDLVDYRDEKLTANDERYFYRGHLLSDGEYLYYLNTTMARFFKYRADGELVLERDKSADFGPIGHFVLEQNRAYLDDLSLIRGGRVNVFEMFKFAYLAEGRLFLLRKYDYSQLNEIWKTEYKEVFVLDPANFELLHRYRLSLPPDTIVQAFGVDQHSRLILVLDTEETIRVATASLE